MALSDYALLQDFCEEAGEPVKASYKIPHLAKLLGIDKQVIYDEVEAGRLRAFMPRGLERGAKILAAEAEGWLEESCQR